MQSKKHLQSIILAGFVFLALAFVGTPQVKAAAYDCAANVTADGLAACCYPENSEPYQGVFCRADNLFLQKIGSNPPTCKSADQLLTSTTPLAPAKEAIAKNYIGFNCFTNSVITECKDSTYCKLSTGCISWQANAACTAAHKDTVCGTICGNCSSGYFQCGSECVSDIPVNPTCTAAGRVTTCSGCGSCSDPSKVQCNGVCQAPFDTSPNAACPAGRDQCTGACNACPAGMTPSGKYEDRHCVNFSDRFIEILSYGLARYGKVGSDVYDGKYDYSVTGLSSLMSDVFLKSDVAETLNWASPSLPPVIQNLITNNGSNSYFICSASQACPSDMTCSEGGLCYTAGTTGLPGVSCANASSCNLGLICTIPVGGTTGVCANPDTGLVYCATVGAACAVAGQTCGTDHYCHNQAKNAGDDCTSNSGCAEGLFCSSGFCVSQDVLSGIQYKGMSATTAFDSVLTSPGYTAANDKCNLAIAGSHVCTVEEMLFLANNSPASLPASGQGWINGGPPGFPANTNDCNAWTVKPQPPFTNTALGPLFDPRNAFGRFWNFTAKNTSLKPCNETGMAFLCCK